MKVNIFPTITAWQEECAGALKVMDRCRQRPDLSPHCAQKRIECIFAKGGFKKLSFNLIFVGLGATICIFHEHWEMKSHIGDKKVDIVRCVRCSNNVISCRNSSGKIQEWSHHCKYYGFQLLVSYSSICPKCPMWLFMHLFLPFSLFRFSFYRFHWVLKK